ncbi:MAG: ribosomal protein [Candidatus Parcubacteria bacterium]|jgi:small subunit ribosomal protein S17
MTQQDTTTKEGGGREFRGTVVSSKMKDTVVVAVERYVKHPKYQKFLRRTKKFLAHDEGNTSVLGTSVTIRETRPISRRKTFIVVK